MKKIAVLTSGGDAPGMNAAIRSIVRIGLHYGMEVYGVIDGYRGLIERNLVKLTHRIVSEKLNRGGTFLGTSRYDEFMDIEVKKKAVENLKEEGIDVLVVIGGEGTIKGAQTLSTLSLNCIAIPATIDNDVAVTDYAIGFDTALNTVVEAIDKLRDTSSSHQRCSIIETMGRNYGELALQAGIACGAEVVITPERNYSLDEVSKMINEGLEKGKKHAIVIVAENILDVKEFAKELGEHIHLPATVTVLGHVQRGGTPTAFDRVLATRMGSHAIQLILENKYNKIVAIKGNKIVDVDLEKIKKSETKIPDDLFRITTETE